jgi:transposase
VRDLVPAIWLPTPELRPEREISRWRLQLVKHRTTLKNRVHSTLIAFGWQVPMADLFGVAGRRPLSELDIPEPWCGQFDASLELIDDLVLRIGRIEGELQRSGADYRYVPLLNDRARARVAHLVCGRVRDRRPRAAPVHVAGLLTRGHRPV